MKLTELVLAFAFLCGKIAACDCEKEHLSNRGRRQDSNHNFQRLVFCF